MSNNNQDNKIIFTNGSEIIPLKSNGEVIRGQRRMVINDISDISDYISSEELDKILDEYVNKNLQVEGGLPK